ncbi:MAG TPA: hypothetical protein DCR93_06770 [Cytophagales bacterium]|nr:hypothetical protein [Cytophagales bacterium]
MREFLVTLHSRNAELFWFGLIMLVLAGVMAVLSRITTIEVMGVNAWHKPIKFALSTTAYAWTMGWITHYLAPGWGPQAFTWGTIVLLGFEVLYIALQAGRGMLSHYNMSTPTYAGLYAAMALAATAVTVWTAYIGVLFFRGDFPQLPVAYLWGIRIGIILFVAFSLEGFVMGSRLTHTIGGPDGNHGIPFLGWSLKYGDPRVAHFVGMHALQVLPLLGFYLIHNPKIILTLGVVYGLVAVWVLVIALQGKPLVKLQNQQTHAVIE